MITLDEFKRHLRIEDDLSDKNLADVLNAAICHASNIIDSPIPWTDSNGAEQAIPWSVKQAIFLLGADYWENREDSITGITWIATNRAKELLMPYRRGFGV